MTDDSLFLAPKNIRKNFYYIYNIYIIYIIIINCVFFFFSVQCVDFKTVICHLSSLDFAREGEEGLELTKGGGGAKYCF